MSGLDHLEARLAIEDLNAGFAFCLDHNLVDALLELFAPDAIYSHGERRTEGREALRALFIARHANGVRTTRHFYSGLRVQIQGTRSASGTSLCMAFAANQAPPVGVCVPHLVADFIDNYALGEDGRWRIQKRLIQRVFAAGV